MRRLLHTSAAVTFLAAAGSVVGFVLQIVVAKYFGAGKALDAYVAGASLPILIIGGGGGGLASVVVPLLEHHPDDDRAGSDALWAMIAILVAMCVGGVAAASPLIRQIGPGLSPEAHGTAVRVMRVMWLAAGANLLASFFLGLLHLRRRFLVASAWLLCTPVCLVVCTLILAPKWGVLGLAAGWALGSIGQAAGLAAAARPRWQRWSGRWRLSGPAAEFVRDLGLALAGLLPFTAVPMLDAYWGTQMEAGSLSLANYGYRIAAASGTLLVNGLVTVAFPYLAGFAVQGQVRELRRLLGQTVAAAVACFVPVILVVCWLRIPLVRLCFQRGAFTPATTQHLAELLPWYLGGALAMGVSSIVLRALFAVRAYTRASVCGACFLPGYFVAVGWFTARFGFRGFGMGYVAAWTLLLAGYLAVLLRRLQSLEVGAAPGVPALEPL